MPGSATSPALTSTAACGGEIPTSTISGSPPADDQRFAARRSHPRGQIGELLALGPHVVLEERLVDGVIVEVMGRENRGEDGDLGVQRGLDDLSGDLDLGDHLVGGHAPDQQDQGSGPRLEVGPEILHEFVVDAATAVDGATFVITCPDR